MHDAALASLFVVVAGVGAGLAGASDDPGEGGSSSSATGRSVLWPPASLILRDSSTHFHHTSPVPGSGGMLSKAALRCAGSWPRDH